MCSKIVFLTLLVTVSALKTISEVLDSDVKVANSPLALFAKLDQPKKTELNESRSQGASDQKAGVKLRTRINSEDDEYDSRIVFEPEKEKERLRLLAEEKQKSKVTDRAVIDKVTIKPRGNEDAEQPNGFIPVDLPLEWFSEELGSKHGDNNEVVAKIPTTEKQSAGLIGLIPVDIPLDIFAETPVAKADEKVADKKNVTLTTKSNFPENEGLANRNLFDGSACTGDKIFVNGLCIEPA